MPSLSEVWPAIKPALLRGPSQVLDQSEPDLFGRMIQVVLEATVDARKATAAVGVLREADFLRPEELAQADLRELEETLRAGHVTIGPKPLRSAQRLAAWVVERGLAPDELASVSMSALRDSLLSVSGIGSATSDAILLFGLEQPSYPVDRATYRILARHGWIDTTVDYEEARDTVLTAVGTDPASLVELSEAMVRVGREFCKLNGPRCERCPLRPWLPESGPIEG